MTTAAQVADDFERRIMQAVVTVNEGTQMTVDQFADAVVRTAAVALPALLAEMAGGGRPDLAAMVAREIALRAEEVA